MTLRRSVTLLVALAAFGWVVQAGAAHTTKTGSTGITSSQGSACIAHRPNYVEDVFEPHYTAGCTGHDEPELDPVSSAAHSAKNLTWRFVLPSDGAYPVSATGPTFWFGGTVTDPNSFGGQAFLEVQFYPDALVHNCTPNGGFVVSYAPNSYSVCSPVWSIHTTGQKPVFHEPAAFNAMLTTGSKHQPLVMHAGDTIDIHFHVVSTHEGWHIDVLDETTGGTGTIVLNSADGPLLPAYDKQEIGNALSWGSVFDTPNSFVWEIGHTSPFTSPASQFCIPGEPICQSFNAPAWAGTSPIQIKSVTFGDGSHPTQWATVSDTGGKAEVLGNSFVGPTDCTGYGGPFCIYPWYTLGASGFHYGVDYPDEINNLHGVDQFAQTQECGGPFGDNSTYCDTIVYP
ncbi:MAG TPA: hypothetical protein VGM80_16010 [Gaiellaceae bacterium]